MTTMGLLVHRVRCLVPSCGKRVRPNRSGNYAGHRWGSQQITCPGGGTLALEVGDHVWLTAGDHAVNGVVTWLGWDTTGLHPGALAKVDIGGEEITRRTSLLARAR
jgi:hypothetical protein